METIAYLSTKRLTCLELAEMVKQLGGSWSIYASERGMISQGGNIERENGKLCILPPEVIEYHDYTRGQLQEITRNIGAEPVSTVPIDISSRSAASYELAMEIANEMPRLFGGCMDLGGHGSFAGGRFVF